MAKKVHIRRQALPWRGEELTECGRPIEGAATISAREFVQRPLAIAKSTCSVCVERAEWYWRRPTSTSQEEVATDIVRTVMREVERVSGVSGGWERLARELEAIGVLVPENRERFDYLVNSDPDFEGYRRHLHEFETYRAQLVATQGE